MGGYRERMTGSERIRPATQGNALSIRSLRRGKDYSSGAVSLMLGETLRSSEELIWPLTVKLE